jgi:Tfp pilus assembly protein PilV
MVALAILGVAIVAVFQLFSISLRSTRKAEDYTKALFYARSLLDEAYSLPDLSRDPGKSNAEFRDGFEGTRRIAMKSSSEDGHTKLYEITVTVTWPPKGSLTISGLRTVYETE